MPLFEKETKKKFRTTLLIRKCPSPEKLIDCPDCFIFSRNIQITTL